MRQLKITKQVTNRDTASLDKYLQEIGRVDLITAEEEVELALKSLHQKLDTLKEKVDQLCETTGCLEVFHTETSKKDEK